ncbi:MAG TPA: response regulator transcription factor [Candidatus Dormibacteraeota bacterium]|jgi:DNA-binding response OmpR family regulator
MSAVILDLEPDYREVVALICRRLGLLPAFVADRSLLLEALGEGEAHLLIADSDAVGGAEGIAELRRETDLPLIVLGGGPTERYLEAGADYHLPKPFAPALLRTTAQAALRRSVAVAPLARTRMVLGRVVFEPSRRRLSSERGRLSLTSREADLLEFLATHTGQVISRAQIIEGAWGGVAEATDAAVVSSVYRLRRKLVEAGATVRIATVPGQGYRLLLDAGPGRGLLPAGSATVVLPRS